MPVEPLLASSSVALGVVLFASSYAPLLLQPIAAVGSTFAITVFTVSPFIWTNRLEVVEANRFYMRCSPAWLIAFIISGYFAASDTDIAVVAVASGTYAIVLAVVLPIWSAMPSRGGWLFLAIAASGGALFGLARELAEPTGGYALAFGLATLVHYVAVREVATHRSRH